MIFKLLILSLCLKAVLSFGTGAPSEACLTLVPTHGSVMPIDIPVEMVPSANTVRAGYPLPVILRSLPDTIFGDFFFRGFIIQARIDDPSLDDASRVVGSFDSATGAQIVDCPTLYDRSTLTHAHNGDRSVFQFVWRAPHGITQNTVVRLQFSVVMNVGFFWPGVTIPITVTPQ